jgi:hypothetical protein
MRVARALYALPVLLLASTGCTNDVGQGSDNITDVPHTPVERQSIGNCWLYAQASWVESMHLAATGEELDLSQSYWTYWHWFEQIDDWTTEISTGGNQWTSNDLVLDRGLMADAAFVAEDAASEMSLRQRAALDAINAELKSGRLKDRASRSNPELVRTVLDDAWQLTPEVRAHLDKVFGKDGARTLSGGASVAGTPIIPAKNLAVRYAKRAANGTVTYSDTSLATAISEWRTETYPTWGSDVDQKRRAFQIRVQRALHARQPVVTTWDVDFNAMESGDNERRGSFNLTTLKAAGRPGRQGGHMTVLEDYEAVTEEYGLLAAGVTLDPEKPEDAAKLEAALLPSTTLRFLRIKNSWGAFRDDRASAPGFPGYHDLYVDYLNGPIKWCPNATNPTNESCTGSTNPFDSVMLPPGF